MPKLAKKIAQKANAAELKDGDLSQPLPPGRYIGKLEEVEVKEGEKGEYWQWTFKLTEPKGENRKAWVYTTLADGAEWKLKEVFTALGYSADSDTDEMIGESCLLSLTTRTISTGDRKGEKSNQVAKCLPLDDETVDALADADEGELDDEKGF